jgi:hypothetical protein
MTQGKTEKERQLADGIGWVEGGGGVKSYNSEKAWSSINHSILSACMGPIPVSDVLKKFGR